MMPKLGNVHTIPCWQGKPACGSTLCLLYLYNIYYIIYILYYYIYIVLPVIPGRFFIVNTFDFMREWFVGYLGSLLVLVGRKWGVCCSNRDITHILQNMTFDVLNISG